ncbi:MAG: NlpC/P60 family protein [Pseudomonadota bacterium]|nr:NlpC/P60 family protein [Pseudomonadota bacterium]
MNPSALDPRTHPYRADLAADWLAGQVDAARFVAGDDHVVVRGSAPLRRAPAAGARWDSELLYGERFTVFETAVGWAWGQNQTDGYVGYVAAGDLAPLGDAPPPSHEVTALRTPVLPAADLKEPATDYLHLTCRVAVTGRNGDYLAFAGGWLYAAHLAPLTALDADVIATARRFLHTPYLWGGRSSFGLDCSALVQLALARAGRAVPRDSDQQEAALGTLVPGGVAAAEAGDLVFCPGHVGWVSGPDRLLHANAHHMAVAEEPLSAFAARIAARGLAISSVRRL